MTKFSKLYEQATPEKKYQSSMRLLKGNDDPSLQASFQKLDLKKHVEKVYNNQLLCDEDPQTEYHTFMIHAKMDHPDYSTFKGEVDDYYVKLSREVGWQLGKIKNNIYNKFL